MDTRHLLEKVRVFIDDSLLRNQKMSSFESPMRRPYDSFSPIKLDELQIESGATIDPGLLEEYIIDYKQPTFSELLIKTIDEKGLKDSDVYRRAGIDRRLFSKLRSDQSYQTSKRTVFSLILALKLDEDEAFELLQAAGYSFSRSFIFDLVILFFVTERIYDLHLVNLVLDVYGLEPMGCSK